jgi:hypothetical protein
MQGTTTSTALDPVFPVPADPRRVPFAHHVVIFCPDPKQMMMRIHGTSLMLVYAALYIAGKFDTPKS